MATLYIITAGGCYRKTHPVVIEMPPNRVAVGGELSAREERVLYNTIGMLSKRKYKEHHYQHPLGVSINYNANKTESTQTGITVERHKEIRP
jgi:hypothetical protein